MFVADCLQVNQEGHLCVEQRDVLELAAKYGTPLYVMSETQIRKNCRLYQDSLKRFYDGKWPGFVCQQGFLLQRNLPHCLGRGNGSGCSVRRRAVYSGQRWIPLRKNLLPWQQQDSV